MRAAQLILATGVFAGTFGLTGPASAAGGYGPTDAMSSALARTQLRLTFTKGEKARPAQRSASLTCNPAGGTHQQAREACAAISAVRGDLAALHVSDGMCTMQYEPVTVTASGRWKGKAVRYQRTFGNACVLWVETGPVFSL
jgi:hypothetical protein